MSDNKSPAEILEQQKKRRDQLAERRTRVQVNLENHRQMLAEAKAEAETRFGTSDLDALRELYRKGEASNSEAVMEFVMALDGVEEALKDLERQAAAV